MLCRADLLDDKERKNLGRQLYQLKGKLWRAKQGMLMVPGMEIQKMQKVSY